MGAYVVKPNEEAQLIIRRVDALPEDDLLARYHGLIDKRFDEGRLTYGESFELERIEARMDAEDQGEVRRLNTIQHAQDEELRALLTSIQGLLNRLRTPRRF